MSDHQLNQPEISSRPVDVFPEIGLQIYVTTFRPGAFCKKIWDDPNRLLDASTYLGRQIPIDQPFICTYKFVDGPNEVVEVPVGTPWPNKAIRKGLRQVFYHPQDVAKGGEHFCVVVTESEKNSLLHEIHHLKAGESVEVPSGKLATAIGPSYELSGKKKSGVSVAACIKNPVVIKALEPCRVALFWTIPLDSIGAKLG